MGKLKIARALGVGVSVTQRVLAKPRLNSEVLKMKTHDEYARERKPLAPCRPEHMKGPYYYSNCGFQMPTCRGMGSEINYDTLDEHLDSMPITIAELQKWLAEKAETTAKKKMN